MNKRRLAMALAVFMALMMFLTLILSLVAEGRTTTPEIDRLRNNQTQLADEKKRLQSELNQVRNNRQSAVAEKTAIDNKIRVTEQELDNLNNLIAAYSEEIIFQQNALEEAEQREEEQYLHYLQRLRAMEEMGSGTFLSIIFQADSLEDLLDRANSINLIMRTDEKMIAELKARRDAIDETKKLLETHRFELYNGRQQQQEKQDELMAEYQAAEKRIQELESNEEELRKAYAEKDAAEKEMAASITKLMEELARRNAVFVGGEYMWPLPSQFNTITSDYGWRIHPVLRERRRHTGIDIGAPTGTPIYAANTGTVAKAEYHTAWGNMVLLDHGGGHATLYAHMTRFAVRKDQRVTKGDVIGYVGSTGWSTGPHLHFEIIENGQDKNPMNYFRRAS
jgi:murein DD-endopeptidase MepM/ murein hydrolase activator NlpD